MNRLAHVAWLFAAFSLLMGSGAFGGGQAHGQSEGGWKLIDTTEPAQKSWDGREDYEVRRAVVSLNVEPLRAAAVQENDQIQLALFDEEYVGTVGRITEDVPGVMQVRGSLDTGDWGYFILSYRDGRLQLLASPVGEHRGAFEIRYDADVGAHIKVEHGPDVYDRPDIDEGHAPRPPEPKSGSSPSDTLVPGSEDASGEPEATSKSDHPAEIDVMIAYTPAARDQANAEGSDIDLAISQAMGNARETIDNTEVAVDLDLVHTAEVGYAESGDMETDLRRLTDSHTFDLGSEHSGYMEEVHQWRFEHGADLVALLVEGTGGIAWLPMSSWSGNGRPEVGFSVTGVKSTVRSTLVFIHELGHNMGMAHSRMQDTNAADEGGGVFEHSTGWRWTLDGEGYVSTMTYLTYENDSDYARVPVFSSPELFHQGEVPAGSDGESGDEAWDEEVHQEYGPADNRSSLQDLKRPVAAQGDSEYVYPALALDARTVTFGSVPTNETARDTIHVESAGNAYLTSDPELASGDTGHFATSDAEEVTLLPGETQALVLEYAPESTGSHESTVAIEHNAGNTSSPIEVTLEGEGVESDDPAPAVAIEPEMVEFEETEVSAAATETLMVENEGDADLDGAIELAEGADAFDLEEGAGAYALEPGERLDVEVAFAPEEPTHYSAALEIAHGADNEPDPVEVELEGEGIAPAIAVGPETVDFGEVETGERERETVAVESEGGVNLEGSVALAEGEGAFGIEEGAGDYELEPGENLDVEVAFAPEERGEQSATLKVSHNAYETSDPAEVPLEGRAITPPEVAEVPAAQELAIGGAPAELGLTGVFDDPIGEGLDYSAESSNEAVATAEVSGETLIVEAASGGATEITATAANADGTAEASFEARANEVVADVSRSFGALSDPANYRLVGLPGRISVDAAQTVSGEEGLQWRIQRQESGEGGGLEDYDGSEAFHFRPGRGFWVLAEEWSFDRTVEAIDEDTPKVDLQEGWNVVSNPLARDLDWAAVQAENGLEEPLWQWDGTYESTSTFATAREGEAYYLFSEESQVLELPREAMGESDAALSSTETKSKALADSEAALELEARLGGERAAAVTVGLAPGAEAARWHRLPPAHFAAARLVIDGDESESYGYALPYVSEDKEGRAFDLKLKGQPEATARIVAENLRGALAPEKVGKEAVEAVLVAPGGKRYDLAAGGEASLDLGEDGTAPFQVLLASAAYVEEQTAPGELALHPPYPNPASERVAAPYELPEEADVRIAAYNALGQEIAVLENSQQPAGRHEAEWNVSRLSSGTYFLRLEASGHTDTEQVTVIH